MSIPDPYFTPLTPYENFRAVLKRRIWILILVPVLAVSISIAAILLIQPKYESSISILVQKEETLNPLVLYEMAVTMASEDRLKSFNEIIYSRTTIQLLIDSLGLDEELEEMSQMQAFVEAIRSDISTRFRSSDSFDITFQHTDPVIAQKGVQLLADHFIQTRLRLENSRNEQAVLFFEQKEKEFEEIVAQQQRSFLATTTERMKALPVDASAIQSRLEEIEIELRELNWQSIELNEEITSVGLYLTDSPEKPVSGLYSLQLAGYPFDEDLSLSLDAFRTAQNQFTETHPSYKLAKASLLDLVSKIPPVLEQRMRETDRQILDLDEERKVLLASLELAVVSAETESGARSEVDVYRSLLDEMRVKLEQARITRDLGRQAVDQFVVLDEPILPEEPTSPNRRLLLLIGGVLGLFLAGLGVGIAEFTDSTLRHPQDLEEFEQPILAFLQEGNA